MKGYSPFSGIGDVWYSEGVGAADIGDDGFVVRESDDVSGGDDVVNAYEGSPVAVQDNR